MKKLFFTLMIISHLACHKETPLAYILIPDKAFETRLIGLGFDSDKAINGKILRIDAEKVDSLLIGNPRAYCGNDCLDPPLITSLKGIETFTNLRYLECFWNEIDSLDLSKNIKLEYLFCSGLKPVTSPPQVFYNVKKYILLPSSLIYLNAGNTSFSKFNSTDLVNIETIRLSGGNYEKLDLSNCSRLKEFVFYPTSKTIICVKSQNQITEKWAKGTNIIYEVCK